MNWGEVFFRLHHYCNLDKWRIWGYTLPQITELMRSTNKFIQFEAETRMSPLGMLGGLTGAGTSDDLKADDDEYIELNEDGFNMLASALGG